DIANHLAAAKSAGAFWKRAHVGTPTGAPIEIRPIRRGKLISPGEWPLGFTGGSAARNAWFAARGHFPFGFGRQATFGPAAKRFRLIPIHVQHWQKRIEWHQQIEFTAQPIPAIALPVDGMHRINALAPFPAHGRPQFFALVAVVSDESGEI